MSSAHLRSGVLSAAFIILIANTSAALGQKRYDPGASDTEIKIGNIMPYRSQLPSIGVRARTATSQYPYRRSAVFLPEGAPNSRLCRHL